ncbi:hypothetical protein F2Q70_00020728 [Brassica cretica]|uniref:Uncharacterized protein n=1 Tax=Brassica cretica TaxID=69181 RepID=A0A3N6RZH8_BRACR|nr:hypothetical protein F2Q70_00020728 [Brassica cretica]KAF3611019.1 hypothetical protein DY000_02046544 [Brassica cretica]
MSQRQSTPVIFIFPPPAPNLHLIKHTERERDGVWLFREGQVRELSEDNHLGRDRNTLVSKNKKDDDDVQRLFQRYFKGSSFGLNNNSSTRFEDSDRKIPSSPDPLHN